MEGTFRQKPKQGLSETVLSYFTRERRVYWWASQHLAGTAAKSHLYSKEGWSHIYSKYRV